MSEIGRKMARGAGWMVLFKLVERSIGLASTVILARLLFPEDFGVVAMAMSVVAMLEILGAFNFDMALIQNQQAPRSHYDTAWTFNVLLGFSYAVALLVLAGPAAAFYEEPRIADVMRVLALATAIQGLENIGVVAFRKEMTFGKEFRFLISKKVAMFVVTISLALWLKNYWALVGGILAGRATGVALSYRMHPYRPRPTLSARRELFGFSTWLLINNILSFLRLRSADFIIGKVAGSHSLGLFAISFEISNLPTTELAAPINRAVYPGYSKLSLDRAELTRGFLQVVAAIALVALPAGIGMATVARPMVELLLGDRWLEAIPLIQVLAVFGAVNAVQENNGMLYLSINRPRMLVYLGFLSAGMLLPLLLWATLRYGLIGATFAYLATALVMLPVNLLVLKRLLGLSLAAYAQALWRPATATALMYLAVTRLLDYLATTPVTAASPLALLLAVATGALVYAGALLLLWRLSGRPESVETLMLARLSRALGRMQA